MTKRNSSKNSLFLMELIIVILFFSISAAICMQVFAASKLTSLHSRNLSSAVIAAENAAECYKASGGDCGELALMLAGNTAMASSDSITVGYDGDWRRITGQGEPSFELTLISNGEKADIEIVDLQDGDVLFTLEVYLTNGGGAA